MKLLNLQKMREAILTEGGGLRKVFGFSDYLLVFLEGQTKGKYM